MICQLCKKHGASEREYRGQKYHACDKCNKGIAAAADFLERVAEGIKKAVVLLGHAFRVWMETDEFKRYAECIRRLNELIEHKPPAVTPRRAEWRMAALAPQLPPGGVSRRSVTPRARRNLPPGMRKRMEREEV